MVAGLSVAALPLPYHYTSLNAAEDLPLGGLAHRKGLLFGSECLLSETESDPGYAALLGIECQILVPGNELKWAAVGASARCCCRRKSSSRIALAGRNKCCRIFHGQDFRICNGQG